MSENEIKPLALKKLIGQYWSIAFCEGSEGRTTDTSEADAQRVWTAIESAIDRLTAERNAAVAELARVKASVGAIHYAVRTGFSAKAILAECVEAAPELAAIDAARSEGGV